MKKSKFLEAYRMWIWFIFISLIISLLVMMISGSLQSKRNLRAHVPLDEFKAHMDERIPALMKLYGIPGCNIALVKDYEVVWTESYGYADVESGRELTVDTPMSVQSITKSVTAWGVMGLVEKGLIDLDAPVSRYLKSWQFPLNDYPTKKITVRQLLSHTAGMLLGDFTNVYSPGEAMPSNREVMTGEAVLTHLQAVPETGDAIVILTNSQRSWPFIAYVLSDWAQWRGFPSVGMGSIIWGQYGLCVVIGILVSASLLVILRLVSASYQQKRTGFRLLRVSAASILLGILIWCACQEYLFITSVFPVLSIWLEGAVFVFSIVLLLSVVLLQWPRKKNITLRSKTLRSKENGRINRF